MEVFERPTLAQVFRRFYPRYRQSSDVRAEQRRAAWSIQVCRTPALGEDQWECEHCHRTHTVYHSCGNRHCPICQGSRSYAWLEGQQERLLPVPYVHVVFSVASELNLVMLYNRKLLFQEFFLSLYTHRAAISSGRLLECDDRSVSFAYKDYRQGGQTKTMRLGGEVFVGRFLQHVAPKGFRRIRHYGFLANGAGREAVRQVQEQWLTRVLILLAVLGQLGLLLDEGCGAEPGPGDWTAVCPFCGQGPLRYLPKRLERVRPDDTS